MFNFRVIFCLRSLNFANFLQSRNLILAKISKNKVITESFSPHWNSYISLNRERANISIEAVIRLGIQYSPIRKKESELGGSLVDVSSWKIVIAMRMVMHRDTRSPHSGGSTKVKNTMQAISAQGNTKLMM